MNLIDVKGVSYSRGSRTILRDITFSVPQNSGFALLGPNGAGKTTTIRVIGGLISPECGGVMVEGKNVHTRNAYTLRESMGFQLDCSLYERLTAQENLQLWGELYGMSGQTLRKRIDELLDLFRLTDRRNSKVGEFSKGMKQQIALCRAMIAQPKILILDEPTSGLSPEIAQDVIDYIAEFRKKHGSTILLCTHELFGLEKLIDHVAIIDHGATLISGCLADVRAQYWPDSSYRVRISGVQVKSHPIWKDSFWSESKVRLKDNGTCTEATFLAYSQDLESFLSRMWSAGLVIEAVEPVRHTLRDVYFETLARGES